MSNLVVTILKAVALKMKRMSLYVVFEGLVTGLQKDRNRTVTTVKTANRGFLRSSPVFLRSLIIIDRTRQDF